MKVNRYYFKHFYILSFQVDLSPLCSKNVLWHQKTSHLPLTYIHATVFQYYAPKNNIALRVSPSAPYYVINRIHHRKNTMFLLQKQRCLRQFRSETRQKRNSQPANFHLHILLAKSLWMICDQPYLTPHPIDLQP